MAAKEFRGFKNLVYAEVLTDGDTYTTGEVKTLAAAGEISKTVEQSTTSKYYDDVAAINISSEGADTVELSTDVISPEVLAEVNGQYIDPDTGAFAEGDRGETKYFAIGYILGMVGDVDDPERYVWRHKGTFNIPDEAAKTKDASTDSQGQKITFTGIDTEHYFVKSKRRSKAMSVFPGQKKADVSDFFDSVQTLDTLKPAEVG